MTHLRNCWYMAAWADEVSREQPLVRTLLDEPILFYRDAGGHACALLDRCPHRFAPLSKGGIEGDVVTCAYHGLAFNKSGQCVVNPHGPISRALAVRSYPVVEAYRALWLWMGDPALAEAAALCDLRFLSEAPPTAFNQGYVLGKAHYQLFVDNILDLSHTDYLHPNTLGGGALTRARAKVEEQDDGTISVKWHSFDDVASPLFARFLPAGVTRVDAWTEVEWSAPGIIKLVSGAVPVGMAREAANQVLNVHIFSPQNQSSTHYFFASTRTFQREDAALNEVIRQTRARIFATEDEPMIAAQQERIAEQDFWSMKPALLRIDEGAVKVRRRMDALIAAESPVA